jgi:hypothetical protein
MATGGRPGQAIQTVQHRARHNSTPVSSDRASCAAADRERGVLVAEEITQRVATVTVTVTVRVDVAGTVFVQRDLLPGVVEDLVDAVGGRTS